MKTYAIRCYIDGKSKLTHKLTKKQAYNFKLAALHLINYLKKSYKI